MAFVASDHAWASRSSIKLTELAAVPLIMREQGSETRRLIEDKFNELGLSPG